MAATTQTACAVEPLVLACGVPALIPLPATLSKSFGRAGEIGGAGEVVVRSPREAEPPPPPTGGYFTEPAWESLWIRVETLGVSWEEFLRFQQRSARLSMEQWQIASYFWSLKRQEAGGNNLCGSLCAWDSGERWGAQQPQPFGCYTSGTPDLLTLPQGGDCWVDTEESWWLGRAENQT